MKIVIADDHILVSEGLRRCFENEPDFVVVGSVEDGESLVKMVLELNPDIAVVDINMPGISGLEAVQRISDDETVDTHCIILSMHHDPEYVRGAFRVGAKAYLVKSSAFGELVSAAKGIMEGKIFVSPEITNFLVHNLNSPENSDSECLNSLTPRELQTFKLLTQGNSIKEIAFELGISYKTVHTYRSMIMQKLEKDNIADLTRFAIKINFIEI